jgi:hypothetical protein
MSDIASQMGLAGDGFTAKLTLMKVDEITKRPAQMSSDEVAIALAVHDRDDDEAQAIWARLAWRPAWAIRSRRGALKAFLEMFRKG